eukprot:Amastigsp_a844799_3.p2 type:complete len:119 gc:universal Amastigsp_a844799_3:869-513(-)
MSGACAFEDSGHAVVALPRVAGHKHDVARPQKDWNRRRFFRLSAEEKDRRAPERDRDDWLGHVVLCVVKVAAHCCPWGVKVDDRRFGAKRVPQLVGDAFAQSREIFRERRAQLGHVHA